MASREEKKRRQQLVSALMQQKHLNDTVKMAISKDDLKALFEFLDTHLEECDHTLALTVEFLSDHNLDVNSIIPWLNEYGGYCDCEVLLNVIEAWGEDVGLYSDCDDSSEVPSKEIYHKKELLSLSCGIQLEKIPKEWKLFFVEAPDVSYWSMSYGKKGGFRVIVMETLLPEGDLDSDAYWIQQWIDLTGLPIRGNCFVEREDISLSPTMLKCVTVSVQGWLPVYRWIYSIGGRNWYMRAETDSIRKQTDFRELSILLSKLKFP